MLEQQFLGSRIVYNQDQLPFQLFICQASQISFQNLHILEHQQQNTQIKNHLKADHYSKIYLQNQVKPQITHLLTINNHKIEVSQKFLKLNSLTCIIFFSKKLHLGLRQIQDLKFYRIKRQMIMKSFKPKQTTTKQILQNAKKNQFQYNFWFAKSIHIDNEQIEQIIIDKEIQQNAKFNQSKSEISQNDKFAESYYIDNQEIEINE